MWREDPRTSQKAKAWRPGGRLLTLCLAGLTLVPAMRAPRLRLQVQHLALAGSRLLKAPGWGENQPAQRVQQLPSGRLITPEKEIYSVLSCYFLIKPAPGHILDVDAQGVAT